MQHARRSFAAVLLALSAGAATVVASAAPPNVVVSLPPLPASAALQAGAAPDASAPHAATTEKVRKGVVGVELGGRTVAIGTVLGTDGRILTALSSLGAATDFDVRYADGHTAKAKLAHKDVGSDLGLLVPQVGKWIEGLAASENDPAWVELRAMGLGPQGKIAPLAAKVKGRIEARGKDGTSLPNVLDLELAAGTIPGAPIIDNAGAVAGIIVRACTSMDAGPCMPRAVGAPIAILRTFLIKTPASAVQPAPWLGINGVSESNGPAKGVRVVAVAPQSPAEKGGLKAGADLIAAVDGQPVDSPERMADLIGKHAINDTVKLLVLTSEKFREVVIVLRPAPAP